MRELLIGCGASRIKKMAWNDHLNWDDLITLDINPDHKPDVLHDLGVLPYPFNNNEFDEIHAYDVLEHQGAQGDWRFYLDQFSEFWRILKPGGVLLGVSPAWNGPWAWGDPGHTRIISREAFCYLDQIAYCQIGKTPMTDYRHWYKADFECVHFEQRGPANWFVLKAHKPARVIDGGAQ